jgi:hypothetical protein
LGIDKEKLNTSGLFFIINPKNAGKINLLSTQATQKVTNS